MIANTPAAWTERSTAETSHEAAMWSESGQVERFAAVLDALKPQAGNTLLDFGCGTGELTEFLPVGVNYLGYDWSQGMIDRARKDHPGRLFTAARSMVEWDLVACVGAFNLRHEWSHQRTWETLAAEWARCRVALAVCLYDGDDGECLSYTAADALKFAEKQQCFFRVEKYRSNDLLLVLRRYTLSGND